MDEYGFPAVGEVVTAEVLESLKDRFDRLAARATAAEAAHNAALAANPAPVAPPPLAPCGAMRTGDDVTKCVLPPGHAGGLHSGYDANGSPVAYYDK